MNKVCASKISYGWGNYCDSNMSSIWDAYKTPSYHKAQAWRHCEALCESLNGWDLRICGHNSMFFTAGFKAIVDGARVFVYITKENEYYCPLAKLSNQ